MDSRIHGQAQEVLFIYSPNPLTLMRLRSTNSLPLPNTKHIRAFPDFVSSLRLIMQLFLKSSTKECLIILALNTMRRSASLNRAEERIFQGDKQARLGGEKMGHPSRDLCSEAWVKSDKKLRRGRRLEIPEA